MLRAFGWKEAKSRHARTVQPAQELATQAVHLFCLAVKSRSFVRDRAGQLARIVRKLVEIAVALMGREQNCHPAHLVHHHLHHRHHHQHHLVVELAAQERAKVQMSVHTICSAAPTTICAWIRQLDLHMVQTAMDAKAIHQHQPRLHQAAQTKILLVSR
jgi:hypothetical protein